MRQLFYSSINGVILVQDASANPARYLGKGNFLSMCCGSCTSSQDPITAGTGTEGSPNALPCYPAHLTGSSHKRSLIKQYI